ncbi:tyrosine-type recombinase/integrase [Achromobacter ruhlandii]|uniref:tyrosine-type recombinase/integrase n=1 Tax=Achromobacter ruhlandii TaxID=72557 RepID=UPI000A944112|nr:site-specific integrase [Achromobacter ruhlandii]
MSEPQRNPIVIQHAEPAHLLGPVDDDWQAIDIWLSILAARPVSPATLATYQREQRRLRWYCDHVGSARLRSWTYQDVSAYLTFLRTKSADFECPPGTKPGQPGWTPFRNGRMSDQAVSATVRILNTLFSFWQQAGYRNNNPFAAVTRTGPRSAAGSASRRAVPPDALETVRRCMDAREKNTVRDHLVYWRNAFLLILLERTGLRANEVAQANMVDVHTISDPKTARHYWALAVMHQKGGGTGVVPMDAEVMAAFFLYRAAFGLPELPEHGEEFGLVLSPHTGSKDSAPHLSSARSRRRRAMWKSVRTRQSIWAIVREEFDLAAEWVGGKTPEAAILKRASTHWLRHTRGTVLSMQGNELRMVAKAMRHTDPRTTMGYTNLDFLDVVRELDRRATSSGS